MLEEPELSCLVIADISGYTDYLTGVELDHAQDILADLINTVVGTLHPAFRLAKLEGDAAFVYSLADAVDGSLLQDTIEATYFAFRNRLRDIGHATVCKCKACHKMGDLDLKFVAHHGLVARQEMAGTQELVGGDVILVHRLLKNAAREKLAGHAYALFTDACVKAMGIDPEQHRMIAHRELVDVIGETDMWLRDLHEAWRHEIETARIIVSREDSVLIVQGDIAAPRSVLWEYCALPEHRPKWQGSQGVSEAFADGRRGAGTSIHCAHGDRTVIEHILDWRPFDYFTLTTTLGLPLTQPMTMTIIFADNPDGTTRGECRWAAPGHEDAQLWSRFKDEIEQAYKQTFMTLADVLSDELQSETTIAEPALPHSDERFLTQPVA